MQPEVFDPKRHPHTRYNPLRDEWLLVSPQRCQRPWMGEGAGEPSSSFPVARTASNEPRGNGTTASGLENPLAPGALRANGHRNPDYTSTWWFPNDFPALSENAPCPTLTPQAPVAARSAARWPSNVGDASVGQTAWQGVDNVTGSAASTLPLHETEDDCRRPPVDVEVSADGENQGVCNESAFEPAKCNDSDWAFNAQAVDSDLFQLGTGRGRCEVVCFSPNPKLSLSKMTVDEIDCVLAAWIERYRELSTRFAWVQLFENHGTMMGCSNPHPHGQIWASDFVPNEARLRDRNQRSYFSRHGRPMLLDYARRELDRALPRRSSPVVDSVCGTRTTVKRNTKPANNAETTRSSECLPSSQSAKSYNGSQFQQGDQRQRIAGLPLKDHNTLLRQDGPVVHQTKTTKSNDIACDTRDGFSYSAVNELSADSIDDGLNAAVISEKNVFQIGQHASVSRSYSANASSGAGRVCKSNYRTAYDKSSACYDVGNGNRLVCESEHFVAVVPFWAVWPFETLLLPKRRHVRDLTEVGNDAALRRDLASCMRTLLVKYDNLFECDFPYSMGWHGGREDHWQLHATFLPPLLRSATIRKHLVGYELLAQPQRDITAETAAEMLRRVDGACHYSRRRKKCIA